MQEPIKLDGILKERRKISTLNHFTLPFMESRIECEDYSTKIFTEAVFAGGKEKIAPVVAEFQKIKDTLTTHITDPNRMYSSNRFTSSISFRELEAVIIDTFGLRDCNIYPWPESYNKDEDTFTHDDAMNVITFISDGRYPVDSIVTDAGFYDKTKSVRMTIYFQTGVFRSLTAEEITGVFLHEMGHNIDPAIVDIKYLETNALSKYLTDRDAKITNAERHHLKKSSSLGESIIGLLFAIFGIWILVWIIDKLKRWLFDPDAAIAEIKQFMRSDTDIFTRRMNAEAFADNFARMYGFGSHTISGLEKITYSGLTRIKKEKERQYLIAEMMKMMIADEHKTNVHRAYALIKEYEKDLADPKLPKKVKKDIEEDLEELKVVLDKCLNSGDQFRDRVNKLILDELKRKNGDNFKLKSNETP